MIFQADFTIAKNTTKESPKTQILEIAHGIITEIKVRPRPGHAALAHMVIRHHEHQIAPSTEGMSFSGDTFPIDWNEYYKSYQKPYELKLVGWNEDDTYPHTFTVFAVVLPREAVLTLGIVDAIKGLFGGLLPKRVFTGSK